MTDTKAPIATNPELVAACGLYCAACRSFRKGRCAGCRENQKATWCKVRLCCKEHERASCAACTEHADPVACGIHNNLISKVIGVVLNSDRRACVMRIRELGPGAFASMMAERGLQTLPRRRVASR